MMRFLIQPLRDERAAAGVGRPRDDWQAQQVFTNWNENVIGIGLFYQQYEFGRGKFLIYSKEGDSNRTHIVITKT